MEHLVNGTTIFGLALLALAALGAPQVWYAFASRRWPTAPARLLFAAPLVNDENWEPIVRYSYEVGGIAYEGKRWRFGTFPSMDKKLAVHELTNGIDPIKPVVSYDPRNPERASLAPGLNEVTLFIPIFELIVGTMLLVLGLTG